MDRGYEVKLGFYIRSIRKMNKLTQDELAAQMQVKGCDITRSALAKIEAGQRHLYPDEIRVMHEILGFDYNELFAN